MEEIKQQLIETVKAVNIDKLSLPDLSIYLDIVKKLQDLTSKSYFDTLAEIMAKGCSTSIPTAPTVGDLKGE